MKDSIKTMKKRWKLYFDEDGSDESGFIILENMITGEKYYPNLYDNFLEFESNSRIGAKILSYDGTHAEEQFN